MNDQFTRDDLEQLANHSGANSISIYMPTERAGPETEQNHIRLKNLLRQAEQILSAAGLGAGEASELLAGASSLIQDSDFWQHQSDGLAIFISDDAMFRYRQPLRFEEQVIVGDRFHLKPLMPLFQGDGAFYILALAQGENRLYRASRHNMEPIEAEEMPENLAEALWYDDLEPSVQQHSTGSPGAAGPTPAVRHGHGVGEGPDVKEDILRYFRKINAALTEHLDREQAPLVLMGVKYLLPIYREANSYNNLYDEGVTGSFKTMSDSEIHGATWNVVADAFDQERQDVVKRFNNLQNSDTVSTSVEDVVRAAQFGRVDSLFVALDRHAWGHFDVDENQIQFYDEQQPASGDLLDLAAVQTFLNSGRVFVLPHDEIPGGGDVAAIYRY